ncbi:L-aminoadipate-semialdehyde dehydrogenase-phosphopantetheinyl transferase-like [Saccoglossus kowalevskii]|uniref:L-aminoadipate-semialdehyde dehydrogenase-phosphopantetheinyl transferase n=1 Tax=Saccoglossus kowalevskii TaxID=10224 RepID=A0ABM0M4M7_SACKO|nr:PREDICTED: L-aminoadipate-semialdehyde dehydrogenase-phosphopantetheinyl transferase-like [Saccoglossus kowalevskii]
MESVRLAFKFGCWKPSRSEWLLAAQCIQSEEKERIGKFVFTKDGKAAMAGRLLLRKVVSDTLQIPWNEVKLARTDKGKPFLLNTVPKHLPNFNFNVSHQGDYSVIAAEPALQVGVDVMKVEQPNRTNVPDFFHTMRKQFTEHEWKTIKRPRTEWKQLEMFYRHWCLKESYIKAIGIGLGYDLLRLEFHLQTEELGVNVTSHDTAVYVDGAFDHNWHFQETKLDDKHCVAVALQNTLSPCKDNHQDASTGSDITEDTPPQFRVLDFTQLISTAKPLLEEDDAYWQAFDKKIERYIPKDTT